MPALRAYKTKRDFRRTVEPAGRRSTVKKRGKARAFVIQKHAASHLHYDLRLEMGGVLKSWAVPKGVPTKPGVRHLAIEVEDHPLEYGSFEGSIPKGNYGAGTVMLWDRGTYEDLADHPLKSWRDGKLRVRLRGKKLKGEWTLVRTKPDANKPQWLLIKRGEAAKPVSRRRDNESVATHRGMKDIGSSAAAVDEKSLAACPRQAPAFIEPMKALLVNKLPATRDGRLRQPSFLGLREDKNPREVVRERSQR